MQGTKLETIALENGITLSWDEFAKGTFIEHNGIYCTEIGKGYATGEIVIKKELLNPAGIVHGGVIVTLADTVAIIGCGYLYEAINITTVSIYVSFVKTAVSGTVVAKAKVVSKGNNLSVWQVDAYNEGNELIAVVTVTFAIKK